ncbi:hypothetical protein BU16DRAFT_154526 [Lophium mytilinum]|uniref:Uncharacterized protein n=1 Tax=Lophium mytilinum TaxID=390894 RepID=A0A6A6QEA0_9PEZI|nr:hypothetical protein BU16DRAFT_154526 [Lophium mytilinum]
MLRPVSILCNLKLFCVFLYPFLGPAVPPSSLPFSHIRGSRTHHSILLLSAIILLLLASSQILGVYYSCVFVSLKCMQFVGAYTMFMASTLALHMVGTKLQIELCKSDTHVHGMRNNPKQCLWLFEGPALRDILKLLVDFRGSGICSK